MDLSEITGKDPYQMGLIMRLRVYVRVCDKNKTLKLEVLALHSIFQNNAFVLFIPVSFQSFPLSPWAVAPLSVSLYAGPWVRHVAHLLSPFNSSLPIRLFHSPFLCSRHSSLLGQVPFLLMRWK